MTGYLLPVVECDLCDFNRVGESDPWEHLGTLRTRLVEEGWTRRRPVKADLERLGLRGPLVQLPPLDICPDCKETS